MAQQVKPVFVDVANPAMAIECPSCHGVTARFGHYCINCGFVLWPHPGDAGRAFRLWRDADPARVAARPYDLAIPPPPIRNLVDYDARAHQLGIHLFPSSNWPVVICLGFLFLFLGAAPFEAPVRIALAAVGLVILLTGVAGWVLVEDFRLYESSASEDAAGDAHEAGH